MQQRTAIQIPQTNGKINSAGQQMLLVVSERATIVKAFQTTSEDQIQRNELNYTLD